MPHRRRGERARARRPPAREGGPQRIAKLLARAGVASRREIERMIAEGRIALNGEKLTTPATLLESLEGVTVDGKAVRPAAATRLFRFYKPQRTLTAERDPKGRPTIYDKLPPGLAAADARRAPRLHDRGAAAADQRRRIEAPARASAHRRRAHLSRARVRRGDPGQLERLAEGITIEGIHYGSINANLERRTGRNCWIEMSLTEGKNREVRRVLAHLGLQVSRLIRTSYGPLTLEGLEPGDADEVDSGELEAFRKNPEMRIIAGKWRGRPIDAPPGVATRPTADRVRETLFSMLASRLGSFEDLRVADLFAGSGALGFEALSRGARSATFVENDSKAAAIIRRNAEKLGAAVQVLAGSALALPRSDPFDLIFADPPYAAGSGSAAVAAVAQAGWLAPGGWMSVETSRDDDVEPGELTVEATRDVGRARLTLLRRP